MDTCLLTLDLADALKGLTAAEFANKFPDEDACAAYLITARWPPLPGQ